MTDIVLKTEERTEVGSAASRRQRRQGRLPCILLGRGDTLHLTVSSEEIVGLIRKQTRVVDLETTDGLQRALIKDLQYDAYGDTLEHVDFLRVVIGETLQTETALDFFGTPKGVTEQNGVLATPLLTIQIECIPSQIPSSIEVDVRELGLGETIRIEDIIVPEGVEILEDPNRVVASVSAQLEELEESDVPDSPAEPEVIGAKEEEGE